MPNIEDEAAINKDILEHLRNLRDQAIPYKQHGPLGYLLEMAIEDVSLSIDPGLEPSQKMQNLIEFISLEGEEATNINWWLLQVCIRYKMSPNNLFRPTRGVKKYIEPKAVFTYGLLTFYSMSLKDVAKLMGRDRTTGAYHERNISDQREQDNDLDCWLSEVENRVYIARKDTPFSTIQKRMQVKLSSVYR